MTDRELLEMAAKAAGHEVWTDIDGNLYTTMNDLIEKPWNPLTDDGDALRLAVRLGIGIQWGRAGRIYAYKDKVEACYVSRGSAEENTRRAIVHAAARIGSCE